MEPQTIQQPLLMMPNSRIRKSFRDDYTTQVPVAIYGRVSTTHEEQLSAFDNQLDWYQLILRSHPNWHVVETYSEAASGTNTKYRKAFNRMIDDALQGKFQLILTREVCRFARNTVDSLNYVRLLSSHGVEVFFAADGIYSLDTDGELRLTIFSALAQDEARKTSERVRNGQLISRQSGVLYGNNAYGYRHVKGEKSTDSHYVIDAEEAETVRMVFSSYLAGKGLREICTELVAAGRKNASGVVKWDATKLSRILENKLYCGYLAYNKSFKQDFLAKRTVNKDKDSIVYIKSPKVPAIISEEVFEKVQARKQSRKRSNTGRIQCKKGSDERYISKLVCACGSTYKKFKWHVLDSGIPIYGYECRNKHDNCSASFRASHGVDAEGFCDQPSICQWKLDFMLQDIIRNLFDTPVETANKMVDVMISVNQDNTETEELTKRVDYLKNEIGKAEARRTSLELKWLDGKLNDADKDRLCNTLSQNIAVYTAEMDSIKVQLESSTSVAEAFEEKLDNIRRIQAALVSESGDALKMDDEFVNSIVTRIVPHDGKCFRWYLNIGGFRGYFDENAYELYDYWTLSFEQAKRYRKSFNQYLRKNQWEDLKVEVFIRTKEL